MPGVYAIVPVKPFRRAKSRLARALRVNQRAALARAMLSHTLDVLASVDRLRGTVVIGNDLTAQDIARAKGAVPLAEAESGLNAAVSQACAWLAAQGASGALIVPTDLPLLTRLDIETMMDRASDSPRVVIAPDRRDDGTNALLLCPPQALRPTFGASSFEAHCAQAAARGLSLHVYRSATIALDLDLPADLDRYQEIAGAHDVLKLRE